MCAQEAYADVAQEGVNKCSNMWSRVARGRDPSGALDTALPRCYAEVAAASGTAGALPQRRFTNGRSPTVTGSSLRRDFFVFFFFLPIQTPIREGGGNGDARERQKKGMSLYGPRPRPTG